MDKNKMAFGSQTNHIQPIFSLKSRLSIKEETKKIIYHFPSERQIARIVKNVSRNINCEDYDNLLNFLCNESLISEKDARTLVQAATDNVQYFNKNVSKLVDAILRIKWIDFVEDVVFAFQKLLINLLSAHNYYAHCVLESLITNFVTDGLEWPNGMPIQEELKKFENIHFVIKHLLTITPMCKDLLVQCLSDQYPYMKRKASCQEIYVHNLLLILVYAPDLRRNILHLIISSLIFLDVHAPAEVIEQAEEAENEQMFKMDDDHEEGGTKHPVGRSLDFCLEKVFNYFTVASLNMEKGQYDWEKIKSLYEDLILVFDQLILPTHKIRHVQFVMFLLCSFAPSVTEEFLNHLLQLCSTNLAAVTYIASLIARGSFITMDMLKWTIQQISILIHSYIQKHEELRKSRCCDDDDDPRYHTVFYSQCQALFYIIAFRHTDLFNTKEDIQFLETLNLLKIVTCSLNPLRVCKPEIVKLFAWVTRNYQIVYCYSIMAENSRNILPTVYRNSQGAFETWNNRLDSFFPFDPYLLKRSGQKITPFYLNYKTKIEDPISKKCEDDICETDDFLMYGSSPGFKHKA